MTFYHPYATRMLCAETEEEIRERMEQVLSEKFFTVLTLNAFSLDDENIRLIDLTTSQRVDDKGFALYGLEGYYGVSWKTDRMVWGISSRMDTVAKAHACKEANPRSLDWVRASFEPRLVTIDQYAPAGYRLQWRFMTEDHTDYTKG